MSQGLPPRQPSEPRKPVQAETRKGVSPTRNIIGIVAFVILVVVGFLEFRAYQQSSAAISFLESHLEGEDDDELKDLLTVEEVERRIGKPTVPPETSPFEEKRTYVWRGLFRTYKLNAYYTGGNPSGLVRISTEDET